MSDIILCDTYDIVQTMKIYIQWISMKGKKCHICKIIFN